MSREAHHRGGRRRPTWDAIGRGRGTHTRSRRERLSSTALLEQRCALELQWRAGGYPERSNCTESESHMRRHLRITYGGESHWSIGGLEWVSPERKTLNCGSRAMSRGL